MRGKIKKIFAFILASVIAFGGLSLQTQTVHAAQAYNCIINPTMENVEISYVYCSGRNSSLSNANLETLTGGKTISNFYSYDGNVAPLDGYSGYIVFFAKAKDGYLFTGLGANGRSDVYALGAERYGLLENYPGFRDAANKAKAAGYQACFGYARYSSGNDMGERDLNADFVLKAVAPGVTVKAQADKTNDVMVGDNVTITVDVIPEKEINGKTLTVDNVQALTATVNGQLVSISNLTKTAEGTYRGTINYTVKAKDCDKGSLDVNVAASTTYKYKLGIQDGSGYDGHIETSSTTKNNGTTTIAITSKSSYEYSYEYTSNGVEEADYPAEIKTLPVGESNVSLGADIDLADERTTVKDTKNNGLWYFDGWYLNGTKVTGKQSQTADPMDFVGKWTFTKLDVTGEDTVYDGNEHGIDTKTVTGAKDQTQWTYEYSESENGPWTTVEPKFKDFGEHKVYVKAKNGNDELVSSTTVRITQKEITVKTGSKERNYDGTPLTVADINVTGAAAGDILEAKATGSQTNQGSSKNTYEIKWNGDKAKNYTIKEELGTLTVKKANIDLNDETRYEWTKPEDTTYNGKEQQQKPSITDKVTGEKLVEGVDYELDYGNQDCKNAGDIIVTIKGKGNYEGTFETSYTIKQRQVTLTANSKEKVYDGKALTDDGYIVSGDGFVEGEGLDSVTVTGEQKYVGSSENKVTGHEFDDKTNGNNYIIAYATGLLTVTAGTSDEPVDADKVVRKTHDDSKVYKLGDVIEFTIEATNIYADDKDITIEEQAGVEITGDTEFKAVKPGETVTTTARHTVTEEDILNGGYTNTVKAKFDDEDTDFENKDEVKIEDLKSNLVVDKKVVSTPKNGKAYVLGEEIEYEITVTNDGNVTLHNVKVKDELTGDNWTVKELAPGQTSKKFKTTYKVTEKDLLNGEVVNTATATSDDIKENVKPEVKPGKQKSKVEKVKSSIIVDKKAKEGVYKVGEKVTYEITVRNNGNVTVSGIKIVDKLTGDSWTINNLKPGEERVFTTKYTLTKADAERGYVKNVVTVEGLDPNGKSVKVNGEATIKVEKTEEVVKVTNKPTVNKVKTGDESNTTLYVELGLMAVLGCAILFLQNKKSKLLKK